MVKAMGLYDRIGRSEGFANGAAAGLVNSSLESGQVLRDLDAFEQSTRASYLALLDRARRDLGVERLEPWDIDYWLHRQEEAAGTDAWPKAEGLARLRDLMRGIGYAYDSLPIDVKVWDVPTGGVTFPVRPAFEARLLTNPFNGSHFYATLFHEYGHAANAVLMRPDLPAAFLRGDETPLSEGLAETLGHLAYDRHWLERAAHQPADRAAALERVGKMQLLLWLRRTIALNAYFEVTHYQRPGADLDSLYAATYRRFVGVDLPPGDFVGTRDMLATTPLYFQSYLYAEHDRRPAPRGDAKAVRGRGSHTGAASGGMAYPAFLRAGGVDPVAGEDSARHWAAAVHRCSDAISVGHRTGGHPLMVSGGARGVLTAA